MNEKDPTPLNLLQNLVILATLDGGRRNKNLPVGGLVSRLAPEQREILKQLKSDDIAPGKISDWVADTDPKFHQLQQLKELRISFDKKILRTEDIQRRKYY